MLSSIYGSIDNHMLVYKDINVCHFIHSVRPANCTILNIFCYPEKNQTLHMQFSPLHIYIYLTTLRGNLWKIYQKAVKDVRSVYYSERFSEIMNICGYDVNVINSMYRSCTWIWLAWKICNPHYWKNVINLITGCALFILSVYLYQSHSFKPQTTHL